MSYTQGGLMPFALREPQPLTLLENILKTIIHKDIPRIAKLLTDELEKIERIEIPEEESTIHFKFPQPPPSGRMVAEAELMTG